MSTGLVDALAAVGNDQGNERARPGDDPEGEFHQVEERLRVELRGAVDLLEVQHHHEPVEDTACDQDRDNEGHGQGPSDPPRSQLPIVRCRVLPSVVRHGHEDKDQGSTVPGGALCARAAAPVPLRAVRGAGQVRAWTA
ncbi:hypothetical protein [Streptomyces avidinii]